MAAQPTPKIFFEDAAFAAQWLFIRTKDSKLEKLRFNTIQKNLSRKLSGKDLILKPRQVGVTTFIQARMFRLAVTQTAVTATLAHDGETTQKFRRMVDRFYKNLPRTFRPTRLYNNASVTTYPDFDSEMTIATAGSVNTGRGGTYTHLHGSEVAFWKDAEGLLAGIMQGGNPNIILESTPNGAQGWFYQLCMEAMDGSDTWKLHFYPWWEDVSYALPTELVPSEYSDSERQLADQHHLLPGQIAWRRAKQRELKSAFDQEYPEDPVSCFLLSGSGYFGILPLAVFSAPLDTSYDDDHVYFAGLDFGQTNDYTVLIVVDKTAGVMVDCLRINKQSWASMRAQVVSMCRKWNIRYVWGEANSMGRTNLEELHTELQTAQLETRIVPFDTTNLSKAGIMSDLHEALHSGAFHLQALPALKRELTAFQSKQTTLGTWTLGAADGEHDDMVMATAIGLHGCLSSPTWEAMLA